MSQALDEILIDTNLLQLAELQCRAKLRKMPGDQEQLRALAELLRKQGKLAEAAATYGQLAELSADDAEARYLQAILAGEVGSPPPAGTRAAPFVRYLNFLPTDLHEELVPFITETESRFVPALVGNQAEYRPDVRKTLQLSGAWPRRSQFKQLLLNVFEDATAHMHIAPFAPGNISIQIRAYPDGHYFRTHMDLGFRGIGKYRKFVFVYYFHREPKQYSGGELLLYDTDPAANTYTSSRFTRLVPENNSLVLFPCEYYHSVITVKCPSQSFADGRFVINGHISSTIPADDVEAVEEARMVASRRDE